MAKWTRIVLVLLLAIGLTAAIVFLMLPKPKYTISGKITRDGEPLVWQGDKGVLDVKFVPLDREADPNVYRAETDRETGKFTITGIPRGSYRVSIQQMDPFPTHDLLGFALSMRDSFIIRDVTAEGEVINIDIPKELSSKGRK